MSDEFAERYRAFINACFRVYTGPGKPAQLRASRTQQCVERPEWDAAWDDLLIPESETPTALAEVGRHYDALMQRFSKEIGVRRHPPAARRGVVPIGRLHSRRRAASRE